MTSDILSYFAFAVYMFYQSGYWPTAVLIALSALYLMYRPAPKHDVEPLMKFSFKITRKKKNVRHGPASSSP